MTDSDDRGNPPTVRQLVVWGSLLVAFAMPGWSLAGYSLLYGGAELYFWGCFWAGMLYMPAALALVGERRWRAANCGWRWRAGYMALLLFSVCWYGAMAGAAVWRFS